MNNTLKQLQEKAREIWENKAEDFTYEDLDNITTLAFEAGKAEAIAMVLKEIGTLKKKPITNMLQEDEVFLERGMDGVKGFNLALDTLKTKLTAKE